MKRSALGDISAGVVIVGGAALFGLSAEEGEWLPAAFFALVSVGTTYYLGWRG